MFSKFQSYPSKLYLIVAALVAIFGVLAAQQWLSYSKASYEAYLASEESYFLSRTAGNTDRIYRVDSENTLQEVISADYIQEYVITGDLMVVATIKEDGSNDLILISLFDGASEQVSFEDAHLESFEILGDGVIGFLYSTSDKKYSKTLAKINLVTGREIEPVLASGSQVDEVLNWHVLADGSVIVQRFDSTTLMITAGTTFPLERFYYMGDISADGKKLVVRTTTDTAGRYHVYDHTSFSSWPLDSRPELAQFCTEEVVPLNNGFICSRVIFDQGSVSDGKYEIYQLLDEEEPKLLYETSAEEGQVTSISVSKSEDSLLIDFLPAAVPMVWDYYPANPKFIGQITLELNLESGELKSFAGIELHRKALETNKIG